MVLYYLKTSEKKPKFPTTVSFCCRKGLPFGIHNTCNSLGWFIHFIASHSYTGKVLKTLMVCMTLSGFIAMGLTNGLNSTFANKYHAIFAILFALFNIPTAYILGLNKIFYLIFGLSLSGTFYGFYNIMKFQKLNKIKWEG